MPEGKIGSYGHRMSAALQLGCVPIFTKELYSYPFFHHAINWSAFSLHVPPHKMPQLTSILAAADAEKLRRNMANVRRRLLWTNLYGTCHLKRGEGGQADAFDTLMDVLRTPRRHFELGPDHLAPRSPEMLWQLNPWLKERGGEECTKGFRCIDKFQRSRAEQL